MTAGRDLNTSPSCPTSGRCKMEVCVSALQYFTGIRRVVSPLTPVGVLELRVPATGVPFRVFYPAAAASHNPTAPWFAVARGESLHTFVRGYMSCFPGHNAWPLWAHVLISWACWLLTVCPLSGLQHLPNRHLSLAPTPPRLFAPQFWWPLAFYKVPGLVLDAPPATSSRKRPLLVHSHGLTGTNAEHVAMHTRWVQRGYIVVAPTHCDGSAATVLDANGHRHVWTKYACVDCCQAYLIGEIFCVLCSSGIAIQITRIMIPHFAPRK
jgi:hypothetical protein